MKNTKSFHDRVDYWHKILGSRKKAWIETEKEHFELKGCQKYKNYNSFRRVYYTIVNTFKK